MKSLISTFTLALVLTLGTSVNSLASGDHDHDHDQNNFHHLVFKSGKLHIHAQFESEPVGGKENFMTLETKDPATHQSVAISDQIKVILWMPSMGHGSSPTKIDKVVDGGGNPILGRYRVSRISFVMSGDWEVRVQLTDAQGNKEIQSFPVTIAD